MKLHLACISVHQTQTRKISPLTFAVLAPAELFIKKGQNFTKKMYQPQPDSELSIHLVLFSFGDCNLLQHCWQQALFYLHLQRHKV